MPWAGAMGGWRALGCGGALNRERIPHAAHWVEKKACSELREDNRPRLRTAAVFFGARARQEIEMTGLKIAAALAVLFVLSAPANAQSRIGSAKSVKPEASGTVGGTLSAGSSVHAARRTLSTVSGP
jgi:hypothetical protein